MLLAMSWVDPRAGLVTAEKSFLLLPEIETQFPYLPARSLVIISTELYRRLLPDPHSHVCESEDSADRIS